MGINDQDQSVSRLNLELFQQIFEKSEPNIVIESLEEAHGSGRGDNYTAALYRILLKGFQNTGNEEHLKWEKSIICKRLPDSRARREAYRSEALFRNEVTFYTSIWPELLQFQKNKSNETLKAIPQCYLAQNDLVILEDLRIRNFQMPDRRMGLSNEQMEAVLKELAKYHSLSLAYKDQFPSEFNLLKNKIVEGIFSDANTDWYYNYYKRLTKSAIEMVSESLSPNSKYVTNLKDFVGNNKFFCHMVDLVNANTPLGVICHGDCWTNNFLYKYKKHQDSILETCLVDFQLIRYGSLALDIANLIYCCTDKSLRKNHQVSWLQVYHRELVKSLKTLGPIPAFCGTEEQLWNKLLIDFQTFAKFGLGLAMDILPISTCSSEEAPDLYIELCDEDTGAPELDVPPNDMCREKMTDIVVDLVDAGLL